ncbi:RFC checkpoint protein Rad17 [Entomophthora muscae]|uniref:RFC checkpoint protein Rad17 n=2 Tax=Entomophthora muscae TaxID=34485 RepID=A0ACC2SYV7_9FUNG|nr:RFC checkpoint protein Rad17 [Entomophthora muscae]
MGSNPLKPNNPEQSPDALEDLNLDSSMDFDEEDFLEFDRVLSSQKSAKEANSAPPSQPLTQNRLDLMSDDFDFSSDELIELSSDTSKLISKPTKSCSLPLFSKEGAVKVQSGTFSQNSGFGKVEKKSFHEAHSSLAEMQKPSFSSLDLAKNEHVSRPLKPIRKNDSFQNFNSKNGPSLLKKPKTELDLIAELSDDNEFYPPINQSSISKSYHVNTNSTALKPAPIKMQSPLSQKIEYTHGPKETLHLTPHGYNRIPISIGELRQNQSPINQRHPGTSKTTVGLKPANDAKGLYQSQERQTDRAPWTPSSFSSQFLKPILPKIGAHQRDKPSFPNLSTELWSEALVPKEMDDVVVHKNKVTEVHQWLTDALSKKSKARILVLNGPPGTGKSSLVKVLANELQMHIVEWSTPDSPARLNEHSDDYWPGIGERFQKFLQAGMRYKALGSKRGCRGQLVMLDDLPSIEHFETRRRIQTTLRGMCIDPCARFPVVLVASSLGSATDLDSDRAAESNYLFSASSLVPPELFEQGFASRINFNPVAVTFLRKALVRAVELRFDIRMAVKSQITPIIKEIAEGAEGDLRGAINELQLRCVGRSYQELGLSEQATSSEVPLNLFHALGKVFFCKWIDDVMQSKPEAFLASCPVELSHFCDYLFQNYPLFMPTIDHYLMAADAFSYASALEVPWGQDPHPQSTALMRSMILTRGILNATKTNARLNCRPRFFRPATRSFSRQMAGHRELIDLATQRRNQTRGMFRTTSSLMITEFLPYLSLMKKASPDIEAVVKFTRTSNMKVDELKDGDDIAPEEVFNDSFSACN